MTFDLAGPCPLLQVFDMGASLRFYREALGFEVHRDSGGALPDWVWMRRDGADLMLNTAFEAQARPAAPDPARVQAHGDTGLYFRCEDLDAAFAHFRALGLSAAPPRTAPYGMRQLELRDPDGYGICLQHRVAPEE